MKILHVCHKPPFPDVDGGTIAQRQLTEALVKGGHQVDIITFATQKHPFKPNAVPSWFSNQGKITPVNVNAYPTPWKGLVNLALSSQPFALSRFDLTPLLFTLQKAAAAPYDLCILDGIVSGHALLHDLFPAVSKHLVYRSHNIESTVWRSLGKSTHSKVKRWYFHLQANRLQRVEHKIWKKAPVIWHISNENEEWKTIQHVTQSSLFHLPFVYEGEVKPINKPAPNTLFRFGFLGAMNWQPNREAAHFLYREVAPKLPSGHQMVIAGRFQSEKFLPSRLPYWKNEREVANKDQFFQSLTGMILPLFSGSGVKIKAMEAMANGVPLIATPIGVEGLSLLPNKHYLPAYSPSAFLHQMNRLCKEEQLGNELAHAAQQHLKEHFSKSRLQTLLSQNLKALP